MRHHLPNYSEIELWQILGSESSLPKYISELEFNEEIKNNSKLKWKVNSNMFKRKNISLSLNDHAFKRWKQLLHLNWIIVIGIIFFSFWSQDYKLLFTIILVPIFSSLGILDYDLFLTLIFISLGIKFIMGSNNRHFWFFFSLFTTIYIISKLNYELAARSVIKYALTDLKTFWKYYSNKLIDINLYKWNPELRKILAKYPELT